MRYIKWQIFSLLILTPIFSQAAEITSLSENVVATVESTISLQQTYLEALAKLRSGDEVEVLISRSPYAAAELIPAKILSITPSVERISPCKDFTLSDGSMRENCFWKIQIEAEGKILTQLSELSHYEFKEYQKPYFDFSQILFDGRTREPIFHKELFRIALPLGKKVAEKLLWYTQHPLLTKSPKEFIVGSGRHLNGNVDEMLGSEWWVGKNPRTYLIGDSFFVTIDCQHKSQKKRVAISSEPNLFDWIDREELRIASQRAAEAASLASKPRATANIKWGANRHMLNFDQVSYQSGLSNFTIALANGKRIPFHWIHHLLSDASLLTGEHFIQKSIFE